MKRLLGALAVTASCVFAYNAHAGTIYLCKAYSGGTFWAQAHCGKHSALIESIVSVPDNTPFKQQVALASSSDGRTSKHHDGQRGCRTFGRPAAPG